MTEHQAMMLLEQLDYICRWTLRGGNDPEDHGDITRAVSEIADVLAEVIRAMPKG